LGYFVKAARLRAVGIAEISSFRIFPIKDVLIFHPAMNNKSRSAMPLIAKHLTNGKDFNYKPCTFTVNQSLCTASGGLSRDSSFYRLPCDYDERYDSHAYEPPFRLFGSMHDFRPRKNFSAFQQRYVVIRANGLFGIGDNFCFVRCGQDSMIELIILRYGTTLPHMLAVEDQIPPRFF
jgi:hypothetical protein